MMTAQKSKTIKMAHKSVLSYLEKVGKTLDTESFVVQKKVSLLSKKEIVTNIDKKLQQMFGTHVIKDFPSHHLVGEENNDQEKESLWKWYIDPIDGTTLFSRTIEEWGIIIALTYKNEPIASWVYFPYSLTLYSAVQGKGAQKNNQPICVSKTLKVSESIISSVYLDTMDRQQVMLSSLWNQSRWSIVGRSLAKDFSEMAEGKIDVAICFNCASWEYKALSLLVQEAKGLCFDFLGNTFDNTATEPKNLLAVANKALASQVLKLIHTPTSI